MRVSIIISNYNYGAFVSRAIESSLAQTYSDIEIIVVDDGSADDSKEVISRYPVMAIYKENEGQVSAWNAGFEICTGDVIIFLDADDLLLPNTVDSIIDFFEDSDVVKVHWKLNQIDENEAVLGKIYPKGPLLDGDYFDEVLKNAVPKGWGHSPSSGNAWSKTFLEKVKPFRDTGDKHGGETYLCLVAPLFGKIRASEKVLGCYRVHQNNFAGGRSVLHRLERDVRRYSYYFEWLQSHFLEIGIKADSSAWRREGSPYDWTISTIAMYKTLTQEYVDDKPLILVDGGVLGDDFIPGSISFMNTGERGNGIPRDGAEAIEELERLRAMGFRKIVFAPECMWWMDCYSDFASYLNENFQKNMSDYSFVWYDLH